MGLRRRVVKSLLKKYVQKLQDRDIHVDVGKGCIRIDNAVLELAPIREILGGSLPACWEIADARAVELRLDIPWKQLKQRSTTVAIGEVVISLVQHPCASCARSATPCEHWATAVKQRKLDFREEFLAAKRGPAPMSPKDVPSAIIGGLQVSVDAITVRISHCANSQTSDEAYPDADMKPVPEPFAELNGADLFMGPVDSNLKNLRRYSPADSLAFQSKDVRFGALSLKINGGSRMQRLLHPTALSIKLLWYLPSDGQSMCPFALSTKIDLDLQTACIDGDDEQLQAFLKCIVDIGDAEEFVARAIGAVPWSDADNGGGKDLKDDSAKRKDSVKAGEERVERSFSKGYFTSSKSCVKESLEAGDVSTEKLAVKKSKPLIPSIFKSRPKLELSSPADLRASCEPGSEPSSPSNASDVGSSRKIPSSSKPSSPSASDVGSSRRSNSTPALLRRLLPGQRSKPKKGLESLATPLKGLEPLPKKGLESLSTPSELSIPLQKAPIAAASNPFDDQDSDDSGTIGDATMSYADTENLSFGDDLLFEATPTVDDGLASDRLTAALSELDQEDRPTWDVRTIRQIAVTLKVSTLRLGIMLPPEGRVDLTLEGLCFQKWNKFWLTEAQQLCAPRIGGQFADPVARPVLERGAQSVDGVVNSQNQLSVHTCRLGFEANAIKTEEDVLDGPEEEPADDTPVNGTVATIWIIDSLNLKEENLSVKWQGASGEPHRVGSGPGDYLFLWPLEVVLRSVQLLYMPVPLKRLQTSLQLVAASMVEWDNEQQVVCNRAKVAERAKTVVFKDAVVQQMLAETGELPHRVTIHSVTLENVTSDLREITSMLGLASDEAEADAQLGSVEQIETMSVEQLQAEVRMWRCKNGQAASPAAGWI